MTGDVEWEKVFADVASMGAPDPVWEGRVAVECLRCGTEVKLGESQWWGCKACGLSVKPERTVDGTREPIWSWNGPRMAWVAAPAGLLYVAAWEEIFE